MNRIKQAWLALTGRLEPEVREVEKRVEVEVPVYGEAQEVEIYQALDPAYSRYRRVAEYSLGKPNFQHWHGQFFATCEQAFKECPGAEVVGQRLWRIAGGLYVSPKLARITLQPKPKRPKGKVRNG